MMSKEWLGLLRLVLISQVGWVGTKWKPTIPLENGAVSLLPTRLAFILTLALNYLSFFREINHERLSTTDFRMD